jgi:hypothetical protein
MTRGRGAAFIAFRPGAHDIVGMTKPAFETDHAAELDRHFAWFQQRLPPRAAAFVSWLRQPSSVLVRVPLALLLVIGGIFSFLPVLGIWMLPLGLVLIAQDVPPLQKPLAQMLGWIERKWLEHKARKRDK